MSTTPKTKTAPGSVEPSVNDPKPAETPPAQETDWKAEARKHEARAKENFDKATKYDALLESQKTEQQRRDEEAEALREKVKEYETREQIAGWQAEVEKASGVPAAFLTATTKEGMEAQAEAAKPLIAPPGPTGAVGPYVPPEGSAPGAAVQTPGDQFADFIGTQLQRP
jgi:crotonobetainyl-CoA:carnitine CoA-transferase CaiB-like acyl-CoA transferase